MLPIACTWIAVLGLALTTTVSHAQSRLDWSALSNRADEASRRSSIAPSFQTAYEAPVDRNLYRLVPGDRLALGIWGERVESHEVAITPEGDVLLPQIGPEQIVGETLAEAEQTVRQRMKKLYPRSRVTLQLLEPGRIRVAVTGQVAIPGWYELTGLDRVSSALEAAGGVLPGGSERFIRIHRETLLAQADVDPAVSSIDPLEIEVMRWRLQADLSANPRLEPGWRIEVPPVRDRTMVFGAVNGRNVPLDAPRPMNMGSQFAEETVHSIEWRPGDTVAYALDVAGGLNAAASGALELVRTDGTTAALVASASADLSTELRRGDRLEVGYREQWVYVVGAVRRPGRFPHYPGYDARAYVRMAGGETENGSSSGWKVIPPGSEDAIADLQMRIEPGATLRIPERRSYWMTRILTPLASAVAVGLSIVALSR